MHKLRLQFRVGGCRVWVGCVVDPQVVIIRLCQHSLAGVGTGGELGNLIIVINFTWCDIYLRAFLNKQK